MQTIHWKKVGIIMLALQVLFATFPMASYAGLIGTDEMLAATARSQHLSKIQAMLARDDARKQMTAMGVDPAEVEGRLNALTDTELAQLSTSMNQLPAGAGVIEVVGLVFVVLLILELVGVTNIFTHI